MAFQTNVLRDGEWVTETISVQSILRSQQVDAAPQQQVVKAPRCGLLTRTIAESPLTHSILPVRIRSSHHNDVAFIGDHFVQIRELRRDGHLKDIIKKINFGSRIKNACVVGKFDIKTVEGQDATSSQPPIKVEDHHADQFGFSPRLPPQMLMLALESGDSVFMFVRPGLDGKPEFVTTRFVSPTQRLAPPTFHLAVDPSSRYMALAYAKDFFVVYELESRDRLEEKYANGEPLQAPVRSFRLRSVNGVIQQITFLYPRPGDENHIILLLVVVRHRKSRMVIYEWKLGDDLKMVFAEDKQGHRMPVEDQMPLLLIPLTVQSAFIVISPDHIAVCTECLHGPPNYETITMSSPPPTVTHHGLDSPLWTAWTRPFRLASYFESRDCIFLAREDGVVVYFEADEDSTVERVTHMDTLNCNISKAFACVFDRYGDVLILGSESGPGGVHKICPRVPFKFLEALPNWSPAVDFASTDQYSEWHRDAEKQGRSPQGPLLLRPDRLFATCESGRKGSITEYRYGMKANIAFDVAYEAGIKQAWLIPTEDGFQVIMSMPDATSILRLPSDFSGAELLKANHTPYELGSSTLAFAHSGQFTAQITTQGVVLRLHPDSRVYWYDDFPELSGRSISDACIMDDCIAVSAHNDNNNVFEVHVFKLEQPHLGLGHVRTIEVNGEVTSLALTKDFTLLVGTSDESGPALLQCSLQQATNNVEILSIPGALTEHTSIEDASSIEAIGSIVSLGTTVFLGTRSGEVISLANHAGSMVASYDKFGITAARLSCTHVTGNPDPVLLLSCDNNLIHLSVDTHPRYPTRNIFKNKSRVFPVDPSNLGAMAPPIQYASAVDLPSEEGIAQVLVISNETILLIELHQTPSCVPRSIPLTGTPKKLIYSNTLNCLIAAVKHNGTENLAFINPNTGDCLGLATDRDDKTVGYISGLGKPGDRILALTEWKYYQHGRMYHYILVATSGGRLLVVSTKRNKDTGKIHYWTRWKKEYERKVCAVLGYEDGLVMCVGTTIRWEVIDEVDKRLTHLKSFELDSPATSLRITNGKLVVLTVKDSLLVLEHASGEEEGGSATAGATVGLCNADPTRRNGVHMLEMAGTDVDDAEGGITLVSDMECGVGGLWVPWRQSDRECDVVFEAELSASVRKFQRGRTRPVWEQGNHEPKWGRLVSTWDDAEILGISLDGAMYHFTGLEVKTWRWMRFVQNLVMRDERLSPFTSQYQGGNEDLEPRMDGGLEMQVDGDLLMRLVEEGGRGLERLVREHEGRFMELLSEVDDSAGGDREKAFGLAYEILDYYLRPVM
ncbi:mono-functional DNA-alkylating methyl methanesulfonate N-term-domain-containing protein [Apiosordaria backusii]|uniref:Mono-functional DNA-alkylating methyl methanesulfonate N-term-domain-containing protein n=1 Tax=Apiosordaria backusii TaxID=314023 RepID=A0AA40EBZ4_9PEZI|nr:mono-functional DNA-alkylating methyl methanesulfonate N-term-domain-containing protein [Apiosordaria backusii]